MSNKIIYKEGQILGQLIFIKDVETEKGLNRKGIFLCPLCGNQFKTGIKYVKNHSITKCHPCASKGKTPNLKHGFSRHPLYKMWNSMKQRCYSDLDGNNSKKNYYDRGITICENWLLSFHNFYLWATNNGYRKELQLDRIDSDGNYTPENCRFVTAIANVRNRRKSSNKKTSKYIGVQFSKSRVNRKWIAIITIDKKPKLIGSFLTEDLAKEARNKYILDNDLKFFKIQ